jgi:DNA-binding winged helix-turn-helix (wHTH) protein/Tfp pilus assembly protein PilF
MSLKNRELYEFGDFRLDVADRRVERINGRQNGSLPDKSFQTLVVLVRNSGRLISKDELFEAVWPDTFVEENNLDKAIHSIRQFLGEKAGEQKYIETIRRHGYRFVADVRRVEPENEVDSANGAAANFSSIRAEGNDAEQEKPKDDTESLDGKTDRNTSKGPVSIWRRPLSLVTLAAAIVLALFGGWYLFSQPDFPERGGGPIPGATPLSRSQAYDLYVRGKVKVASENREDTLAAIKILEEAITVDPDLAEAHAQLARGYNTMAFKYSSGAEAKRYHENAEVAIEKAINLNPELAEAHFARGLILWTYTSRFPHEKAIQAYKRSLELDPNQDETYHQLSLVYSHIGLLPEAEIAVNQALERNPNNTLARFRAGVYAAYQGRSEEAILTFKTIPRDFTPLIVDRSMAEVLIQAGRTNEAEILADEYLSKFPQDEGGSFTSVKALLLAKAGKHSEAEAAIKRAAEIGEGYGHFHHTAYNIASAYAVMNMPAEAVRWLDSAAENGFPNYPYFASDPNLERIRGDQLFIDFMAKLRPRWERFKSLA